MYVFIVQNQSILLHSTAPSILTKELLDCVIKGLLHIFKAFENSSEQNSSLECISFKPADNKNIISE